MTSDGTALLAAILADPADDTARLVYADWLQEHDGTAVTTCPRCLGAREADAVMLVGPILKPLREVPIGKQPCRLCENEFGEPTGEVTRHNGCAVRAEFIREQIDLNGVPTRRHPDMSFRGWDKRVAKITRILAVHGRRWVSCPNDWHIANGLQESNNKLPKQLSFHRGFVSEVTCPAADWLAHSDAILAEHPVTTVQLSAFRIKIDPPGTDHGWQLYYYRPNEDSYFAMSGGLDTRAEMVERLMSDVRDLESEFA